MKLAVTILLLATLALPAGCATQYYPEYARAKTEVARAEAQTNQQVLATLGRALQSPNPNTQTAAAMGLAFWLAGRRPTKLEQARPSPVEQGIGKAIPSLPMWGAVYGMFSQAAGNTGGDTNINQEVSGSSAGGINLGSGSTTPTTTISMFTLEE